MASSLDVVHRRVSFGLLLSSVASGAVGSRLLSASPQASRTSDVLWRQLPVGVDDVTLRRRAVHSAFVSAQEGHVLRHAHTVVFCRIDENKCVSCEECGR